MGLTLQIHPPLAREVNCSAPTAGNIFHMTCWRIICGIAPEMIEFGLHQQDNDKILRLPRTRIELSNG